MTPALAPDSRPHSPSAAGGTSPDAAGPPLGMLGFLSVLLRYRRTLIACIVLSSILLVGMALAEPRTYTSTAAFMPHVSGGSLAGLSNLAAQLGVNVGKEDPTQSPDFYAEVIKSRDLLSTLAESEYTMPAATGPKKITLADALDLEPAPADRRLDETLKRLRKMIFVNVTRQTGIMHVNVTTPNPDLSRQLAERLMVTLDEFNTRLRQTQAGAEERFLELREEEARRAHTLAEERVVDFLISNRNYESSPSLAHEYSRLRQDASYRAEVVTTLTKARAQARIEAARNTPVITVLDRPNRALRPDGRGVLRAGVLAVILGCVVGITIAVITDAFRGRGDSEQGREFATLRAEALDDLRHPLRALRPSRGRSRDASVR